jgi:hypothetical protein
MVKKADVQNKTKTEGARWKMQDGVRRIINKTQGK